MAARRLSLTEARQTGKLEEFIQQEEEAEACDDLIGADDRFRRVIGVAVTQPRSAGRTSRSPSRGGSSEK